MANRQSTTREDRAAALIASGAVTLNLDGTATVKGSGKAVYTVTKAGCTCPDRQKRGESCKHEIAVKSLCRLYRAARETARETGRVRLPWVLALALPSGKVAAPAICPECGQPSRVGLCADCFLGYSPKAA